MICKIAISSASRRCFSFSSIKFVSKNAGAGHDLIGEPDKQSNLRPVKIYVPPSESPLQKEYRELRMETQEWNQKFWSDHNTKFIKEKDRFISANKSDSEPTLNADQMSVFYKEFLDNNWKRHVEYNIAWYGRNIKILQLAVMVKVENLYNRILKRK